MHTQYLTTEASYLCSSSDIRWAPLRKRVLDISWGGSITGNRLFTLMASLLRLFHNGTHF